MTEPDHGQTRNPARRGRVRGWLLNLLLILLVLGGVQWWKSRPMASGEAPPLEALSLDGRPLDLADLRGQPVLVHFWATWCPVCRLGNGAIDAIARDHRVVTVALQSGDPAEIRDFLTAEGLSFEVLPDQTGAIANQWGVPGVPATFILDPAGRIAFSTPGISSEWGLRARLWAAGLID